MSTRPRYSVCRASASEAAAVRATECSVVGVLIGTLLGGVVASAKDAAAGSFPAIPTRVRVLSPPGKAP
jgi:hypothetical protein